MNDSEQQLIADILSYIETMMPETFSDTDKLNWNNRIYHSCMVMDNPVKAITSVLWDGLAYGNWPWIKFNVNDLLKD